MNMLVKISSGSSVMLLLMTSLKQQYQAPMRDDAQVFWANIPFHIGTRGTENKTKLEFIIEYLYRMHNSSNLFRSAPKVNRVYLSLSPIPHPFHGYPTHITFGYILFYCLNLPTNLPTYQPTNLQSLLSNPAGKSTGQHADKCENIISLAGQACNCMRCTVYASESWCSST